MYYINVVDTAKVKYSHNDDILLINLGGFDAPVLDDSEMEKYKWKLEDFDTEDDKWSNYPNKYDLEYSINNGKTVFINDLTLYTKETGHYTKTGDEVIFGLKSDNGSDWEFNPEISDNLPDDTKVLKADILFKDINTDEDIDEEYTEEFFESVYRESQDPSTKDRFKNVVEKIKSKISNELEYSDESNEIFIKDNETWYEFEVNFGRGRIYLFSPIPKRDQAAFDSDDEAANIIISMFKGNTYAKDSGIIKGTDGETIDKLGNVVSKEIYSVIDEIRKHCKVNKVEVITMEEFKRQNPGNVYLIKEYLDYKGNVKYENAEWSFSEWLPDDKNDDVVKVDITVAPNMYHSKPYDYSYYLYWSGDPSTGSTDGVYGIQKYTYDEILEDLLKEPEGEKEFISLANRVIDY